MEGSRLREMRLARGLTLRQLAREMGDVVTDAALAAWELGQVDADKVGIAGVQALARVFGISTDDAKALIEEAATPDA